ncbi:MAG: hypothetical protein HWN71_11330, partial [Desulfobacterales bacterium]|nr:hypothetical protein [Desulfobacterales bacterium]
MKEVRWVLVNSRTRMVGSTAMVAYMGIGAMIASKRRVERGSVTPCMELQKLVI